MSFRPHNSQNNRGENPSSSLHEQYIPLSYSNQDSRINKISSSSSSQNIFQSIFCKLQRLILIVFFSIIIFYIIHILQTPKDQSLNQGNNITNSLQYKLDSIKAINTQQKQPVSGNYLFPQQQIQETITTFKKQFEDINHQYSKMSKNYEKLSQKLQRLARKRNYLKENNDQQQVSQQGVTVQKYINQEQLIDQMPILSQIEKMKHKPYKMRKNTKQRTTSSSSSKKTSEPANHYDLKVSIDQLIKASPISDIFKKDKNPTMWNGISIFSYIRSIRLLQLTHNINFKGQFQFDHYNFHKSANQKYLTLLKLLKQEEMYYDTKYQTSQYFQNQIGMCVVVHSTKYALDNKLYLRNLDSIFMQQYTNYHVVYINDERLHGQQKKLIQKYMKTNKIPEQKYQIIKNKQKKGNGKNIHSAVHKQCKLGQIFVYIDGNDSLIGRQVFSLLNTIYQKQKTALVYGEYFITYDDHIKNGIKSKATEKCILRGIVEKKLPKFYPGLLKTVFVDVYRELKQKDIKDQKGQYLDYSTNMAYATLLSQLVDKKYKFIPQIIYEHRSANLFSSAENSSKQVQIQPKQQKLQAQTDYKPHYKPLKDFSFVTKPKTMKVDAPVKVTKQEQEEQQQEDKKDKKDKKGKKQQQEKQQKQQDKDDQADDNDNEQQQQKQQK